MGKQPLTEVLLQAGAPVVLVRFLTQRTAFLAQLFSAFLAQLFSAFLAQLFRNYLIKHAIFLHQFLYTLHQ
ncbi:hypothetical protein D3C81_1887430 [compost metagenome]